MNDWIGCRIDKGFCNIKKHFIFHLALKLAYISILMFMLIAFSKHFSGHLLILFIHIYISVCVITEVMQLQNGGPVLAPVGPTAADLSTTLTQFSSILNIMGGLWIVTSP